MTKPNPPALVWLHERRPGEQLRIYQRTYQGRPYYSIESWFMGAVDWQCGRALPLRRYDLRPLLRGMSEAVKHTGASLNRDERERLEAADQEVHL